MMMNMKPGLYGFGYGHWMERSPIIILEIACIGQGDIGNSRLKMYHHGAVGKAHHVLDTGNA